MVEPVGPSPATPARLLPLSQLIRLSVYWLGLVAVFQGIGLIMQERIKVLVPDQTVQYTTLGLVQAAGVIIAVLVQPTVGSISDYTISRFGRRKPYILIGTSLDLLFLIGIATSNRDPRHRGPRRRCSSSARTSPRARSRATSRTSCPDPQVGLASGMVGLFTVLGVVFGSAMAVAGARHRRLPRPDDPARHHGIPDDAVPVLSPR